MNKNATNTTRIAHNPIANKSIANNRGFTLIELMIGTVVSLVVMAGVANVFVGTVKSSSETLKASKLNQDMQAIMNIMVDDIRRAGYWNSLAPGATPTNPFTSTDNLYINDDKDCILYAYDSDANGDITIHEPSASTTNSDDRFGFKLSGKDIMMRRTGENTTNCGNGFWRMLNDGGIGGVGGIEEITALTFTPDFKCINKDKHTTVTTACDTLPLPAGTEDGDTLVETRHIIISMSGTLTGDRTVTKQIVSSVRVRNDRIFTQP